MATKTQLAFLYRAPELYDVPSDCTIDARIDVWSIGEEFCHIRMHLAYYYEYMAYSKILTVITISQLCVVHFARARL